MAGDLRFLENIENMFAQFAEDTRDRHVHYLNMGEASWIEPFGIVSLITVARLYEQNTARRLELRNLPDNTHRYLERMDVFDVCGAFLVVDTQLSETDKFTRSQRSQKLLEVLPIPSNLRTNPIEVKKALRRANTILQTWLEDTSLIKSVLTLFSEVSHNISHSQDEGFAVIQRYKQPYSDDSEYASEIHIAIADLGIGIEKSLANQHPALMERFDKGSEYILHALKEGTSGMSGTRGIGLPNVQSLVAKWDGELLIRSMSSRVIVRANDVIVDDDLAEIPGVQISIIVRGRLTS